MSLARDLKNGIYKLTFKDNMPTEMIMKSWTPTVSMPAGNTLREIVGAVYLQAGSKLGFFNISLAIDRNGTPGVSFGISLPVSLRLTPTDTLNIGVGAYKPLWSAKIYRYSPATIADLSASFTNRQITLSDPATRPATRAIIVVEGWSFLE